MAKKLTRADINALRKDGLGYLVTIIDGQPYNCEDLPMCDACGEHVLELVDGWVCENCLEDANADNRHIRLERNANVL